MIDIDELYGECKDGTGSWEALAREWINLGLDSDKACAQVSDMGQEADWRLWTNVMILEGHKAADCSGCGETTDLAKLDHNCECVACASVRRQDELDQAREEADNAVDEAKDELDALLEERRELEERIRVARENLAIANSSRKALVG